MGRYQNYNESAMISTRYLNRICFRIVKRFPDAWCERYSKIVPHKMCILLKKSLCELFLCRLSFSCRIIRVMSDSFFLAFIVPSRLRTAFLNVTSTGCVAGPGQLAAADWPLSSSSGRLTAETTGRRDNWPPRQLAAEAI